MQSTQTPTSPRLLFFDIDGTLLSDITHELPSSLLPALQKAREAGCMLFINTGRTLCNMDPRMDTLPMDGRCQGCGTRIILQGKTLKALEYDTDTTLTILEVYRRQHLPVVYECDTALYFDSAFASHPKIREFRSFSEHWGIARDIRPGDPEFRAVKMFCMAPFDRIQALQAELKTIGCPYEAIDRGGDNWEMVPEGCSKAEGIEVIRKALGVPLSSCYAFGDSNNDLPMLLHVPNSVCVGNAPPEVQAQCSYVTDRVEDDGIAHALEALGLLRPL